MAETPSLDPAAVRWSAPPTERPGRPLLVLLHGYGADQDGLFGLVPYLPDGFVVAAVRGPLAAPWPSSGASWYTIDERDQRDPAGVTAAASALLSWMGAATDADTVGLLGFSQGAAVSLQALRLEPERFAFAVNLSGYVAPGALPRDAELAARRPPVFWGRGTRDDVIPEQLVRHTTEWLPSYVDLSGRVYPGLTHSVSEAELGDVRAFLAKRLEPA